MNYETNSLLEAVNSSLQHDQIGRACVECLNVDPMVYVDQIQSFGHTADGWAEETAHGRALGIWGVDPQGDTWRILVHT